MKSYFVILALLITSSALAQDTTRVQNTTLAHATFERNTYIATASVGFINTYRSEYTVPTGFDKGIVTGFVPFFPKIEYAVSHTISIALGMAFSTITYNSSQLYTGYNGPISRNRANKFSVFSGALTGYYHLGKIIHIRRLDPFVGVGISLNNLKYSAYPQGDSTVERNTHTATPYLKAGARYYISDKVSVYADAGYDKLSMVTVGISCRFFPKKNNVAK